MDILKRVFGRNGGERQPATVFEEGKMLAASRQVVLIRPDLSLLTLACPERASMPADVIQQVENIVPSSVRRNIAVAADTGFAPPGSRAEVGSPAWTSVGRDLPFFGVLNGLGCIGHTVWIFDASSDLGIACRDADVLIIDGAVSDRITKSLLDVARSVMRTASVFVHDRQTFQLRPEIQQSVGWDAVFDDARARSNQGIVFVRVDQSLLRLPCIPLKAMTKDQLAQAQRVIPEGVPRNVAVIGSTNLVVDPSEAPAIAQIWAAGRAIPFFGLVLNLASAGNPTWVFDGSREAVVPGCHTADLLVIDSALADKIPMRALDEAAAVMRSANIAVYDRSSRKIGLLRSLSGSMDKLIFHD